MYIREFLLFLVKKINYLLPLLLEEPEDLELPEDELDERVEEPDEFELPEELLTVEPDERVDVFCDLFEFVYVFLVVSVFCVLILVLGL